MPNKELKSASFELVNAFVTLHEFNKDSGILNFTLRDAPGNIAIWIGYNELHPLAEFLKRHVEEIPD